jgi:hypothetical protein
MVEKEYKIRRAFLVPLIILVVLLLLLTIVSIIKSSGKWEIIIVPVFFVASLAALIDMIKRKIFINDQGMKIKNVFRVKEFDWQEITHLAVVILKKKIYFLLTTTKGFYIFSNLFENHAQLVQLIDEKIGEDKVEMEVKTYLDHPVERLAPIVMSWVAAGIIVGVIFIKISGF